MANWKKVIVSGSAADLASLTLDTQLAVTEGGTGRTTLPENQVLIGSGTAGVSNVGALTNGQLIIGSTGAAPSTATLGTTLGLEIDAGAGTLSISPVATGTGNFINAQTNGTSLTVAGTDRVLLSDQSNASGTLNYVTISQLTTAVGGGTVTSVSASGNVNGITLISDLNSTSPELTLGGTLGSIANSQLTNNTVSYGGVTLALGGTDATPAFDLSDATGLPLTTGVSGVLPIANGGTNISSYTTGDILYASSGTALAKLGIGSSGQILAVSSGGIVEWINNDEGDITSVANTTNGGLTVTNGTGPDVTLTLNLNNLSAAAVDVAADSIAIIDANDSNGSRKESIADLATAMAGTNITATSGVLSVATSSLTTVANATNGGMEVANGSGPIATLAMDINNLSAASIASGDNIAFSDESAAGDPTKKESIDDVATLFAGTGLTATNAVIEVDYGSTAGTAAEGDTVVSFLGTTNEIELSTNTFTTVGGGGSVTVGLPDNVTITNNLTVANNAIISGDLTVSGTASFTHSDNLDIADKFITLASGSTTRLDGGIIIATGPAAGGTQVGEAFGFNAQAGGRGRWGITGSQNNSAGAIVSVDQMVTAGSSTSAPSAAPTYGGTSGFGNMHVDTNLGDIYIYV
tara:strand:+ start:1213 stop:3126 length:1914 start_codon:yes stop_codon:yes gene_type:complete